MPRQPPTGTHDRTQPPRRTNDRLFQELLDDAPPPTRLPSVKAIKPSEPKISRLPTPPSPPFPTATEPTPTSAPPKIKAPITAADAPSSYPSPLSPLTSDETGVLSSPPPGVARRPTLGNSMEARAVRRQKYSPLAAFGGADESSSPSALQLQAPQPSKTPPPPPPPPKAFSRTSFVQVRASHLLNSLEVC